MNDTTFSDFCPKPKPDALTAALFQAQSATIGLAHKVKMYETALEEIAWSNNSTWQQDRAKQVLAQMRGVEI
jgi:hypothetical protein